jgi:hypothetical protein
MIHGELTAQRNAPEVRAFLQDHFYEVKGNVVCFYKPGAERTHAVVDLDFDECDCPVGRHNYICPHLVAARIVVEQEAERQAA